MARYDYGLRGPRETVAPRSGRRFHGDDRDYDAGFDRRVDRQYTPRVTAPYNMDYVRPEMREYRRNLIPYGGEWWGQIGGEEMYRPPYITQAGTRTWRGAPNAPPYDGRDFNPYGMRFPDEL